VERPGEAGRSVSARAAVIPLEVTTALLSTSPGLVLGATANTAVFTLGIRVLLKGLTWAGVLHSWLLGSLVYGAFGLGGYVLVCVYFLLGSAVTKLKLEQKQKEGIAEARSGRRSPASVYGSGTAAMACAALSLLGLPSAGAADALRLAFVASIASKLSDTCASEVGKAYGKTTYLSTTFKLVPRGTEGAVSLEGTAAGVAASLVLALLGLACGVIDAAGVWVCVGAAFVANWAESVLGATCQDRFEWLSNDLVNVLQITLAALLAYAARHFCGL